MSLYQLLSPSGSFILDWSQSESLGYNIDIKGGVGPAKLSESGKGREGLAILDYRGVVHCWKSDRRRPENLKHPN